MSENLREPLTQAPPEFPHLCRFLAEASPQPMVAVEGLTHVVRYVNPAFRQLLGVEDQHLIGRRFEQAVPEGLANTCAAMLDRVFGTGTSEALVEQEHGPDVWADGVLAAKGPAHWSYLAWAIVGPDGTPAGVMIQVTDSTESARFRKVSAAVNEALLLSGIKQHEMTDEAMALNTLLRQSEERLRTLADAMRQLAWIASADGATNWFNKRWYEYTGATPQEMEGWGWQSVHDPEVLPRVMEKWRASIATGEPFEMIYPLRGKDGTYRAFLARLEPQKDAQGNVTQWFGTNTDIDEVKRGEEALRESQQFIRRVLDNLLAFVGVMTVDGTLIEANRAPLEAAAIPDSEVLGKKLWDCYWWSYSPEIQAQLRDACGRAAGGEVVRYDVPVRMAGDTRVWIDFQVAPLRDTKGRITHLIPSALEIAVRRAAEESLRESQERFRAAVDAVSDIIWTNHAEGKMEGEQPGWGAFTGQRQEEYQGLGWSKAVHPDDAQPTIDAWNLAVAEQRPFEFEHRVRRHDGQWRVCSIRAVPVVDRNGRTREWVGVHTDITERKAAEQELLRHREDLARAVKQRTGQLADSVAKLVASERLAALGTLAAGLGHDIANITMPIRARLDMLARAVDSEEARGDIEATLRGVEHLNNLSAGMRLLALDPERAGASAPVADLDEWCSQTTALFRSAVPRHITVECSMPSGVGVPIPAHRLAQAIFNLVQNAGEAMAGQKAGRIGVSAEVASRPGSAGVVVMRISDDGPGMVPEVLAHCFEPYFSTKGRTISTGMGLGMVKGIVETAGGHVLVESEPGRGATFTLSIPVAPAAEQRTASPPWASTAAVSIRHPRTASLACLFLEQLDVPPRRTPPDVIPEAAIWIMDDPDPARVATYLDGHIHRRVVMLGGLASDGGAVPDRPSEGGDTRIRRLPAVPTPNDLREALAAAGRDARSRTAEG